MEYIKISDSKLKIICESTDLDAYGVCADSLEYGDAQTRCFIEEILEIAKYKLGFETKRHRILVQVYPSIDGGCEIFVSRLEAVEKDSEEEESISKKATDLIDGKRCEKLYFFNSLDRLIETCKRLCAKDFENDSSAFYLAEEGYFLRIELDEDQALLLGPYSFIAEYGDEESLERRLPFLKEYGKCICPHRAAETIGKI